MKNLVIPLNRFFRMKKLFFLYFVFILFGCGEDENPLDPNPSNNSFPNILLIIADDLGKDALNGFSEGSIKPSTPHIDALRTSGISFINFWSYPTCSPTRSSILTGKYGYSTGVKWAGDVLSQSEVSLQRYINQETNNRYATSIVGKWHLSGNQTSINPESFGIDYYAGLFRGEPQSYYNWQLTEDEQNNFESEYTSIKFTDLAIDWINQQDSPWFIWLAYNAPHTPFHVPPLEMHSQGNLPEYMDGIDPIPYYMAAIEALDFQIGRLLENIPQNELDNTTIIFMGDNGSPNEVAQFPYMSSTAKGTLYQGGINTPLFISGNGVTRNGEDENPVTSTDLFATIAEISGVTVSEINDSKSFKILLTEDVSLSRYQYTEKYNEPSDKWAISNGQYKLITGASGNQEFFNLEEDPYEKINLLDAGLTIEANDAKEELELKLEEIRK